MSAWDTSDELRWLERIGERATEAGIVPVQIGRQELLQRYLRGCHRRTDWGDMNRQRIVGAARLAMVRR